MVQNISFKGYMPIEFWAMDHRTNKYSPVVKPENVKKCQSFVIRNLNGTAKKMKNDEFVRRYAEFDKDYAKTKVARTFYDKFAPVPTTMREGIPFFAYVVTGSDIDYITKMSKELAKTKRELQEVAGKNSPAEKKAKENYRKAIKEYITKHCARVKDDGDEIYMKVFFDSKQKKDGSYDFTYQKVGFFPQSELDTRGL